jgi:hypothetical protein
LVRGFHSSKLRRGAERFPGRMVRQAAVEPSSVRARPNGMSKVIEDVLRPIVRSFIEDRTFALFLKLANWLDANIASRGAKVALGFVLAFAAIGSVVVLTALSGF